MTGRKGATAYSVSRDALVGVAVVGMMIRRGWIVGCFSVELDRVLDALRADGQGVVLPRDVAVDCAIGLMRASQGMSTGNREIRDLPQVRICAGLAFDEVVKAVGA